MLLSVSRRCLWIYEQEIQAHRPQCSPWKLLAVSIHRFSGVVLVKLSLSVISNLVKYSIVLVFIYGIIWSPDLNNLISRPSLVKRRHLDSRHGTKVGIMSPVLPALIFHRLEEVEPQCDTTGCHSVIALRECYKKTWTNRNKTKFQRYFFCHLMEQ